MQNSSIIRNTSSLLIAHLAGRILSFALIIILPRYLAGAFDDLGKYFFALWLTNLLATITELGLYTPVIREVAADRSRGHQIITNALAIRLLLSLVTLLIVVLLARFVYPDELAPLICILGISEIMSALAQLLRRIFRAFERMEFEALGLILERVVVFSLGLGVVIKGYGIIGFCIVVLAANILNLALTFIIMVWKFSRPSLKLLDAKLCGYLLKQALPFALGGAMSIVYSRIDGLILKYMMGSEGNVAVGWYATSYNLVMSLTVIPGAFMGAVFPVMARMLHSSPLEKGARGLSAMDFLYTKSLKLTFIIALPTAVMVTFLADKILPILYSAERFASQNQKALSQILEILIWAGALMFLNFVFITIFRAANKRRAFSIIMIASVSVNIGSNVILIPRYGHLGPAISMVVSELFFLICGSCYVRRYICKLNEFGFLLKSAFASGFLAMGLLVWRKYAEGPSEAIHIALIICLGVIAYFAVMLASKGITSEDITMVKGQFQRSIDFE